MEGSISAGEALLDNVVAERGGLDKLTDPLLRFNPKGFFTQFIVSALMEKIPDEERAIIAYARNFVANWQYFASGAQINESEYSRLVDAFFDRSTDGPLARMAKRQMRHAAIAAIQSMAMGGQYSSTPVEPVLNALREMDEIAQSNPNAPQNLKDEVQVYREAPLRV